MNIKKSAVNILVGAGLIVSLSGCEQAPTVTSDISNSYSMPVGMEGCKVYKMESSTSRNIYVVRCPMTTTTNEEHSCGKNCIQRNNVTTPNYY